MLEYERIEMFDLDTGRILTAGILRHMTTNAMNCLRTLVSVGRTQDLYYCPIANPSVVQVHGEGQLIIRAKEIGEAIHADTEKLTFEDGIRYAFDFLREKAANNFHQEPQLARICDIENDALTDAAEDLLLIEDGVKLREWRSISKLCEELDYQTRKAVKAEQALYQLQLRMRCGDAENPDPVEYNLVDPNLRGRR